MRFYKSFELRHAINGIADLLLNVKSIGQSEMRPILLTLQAVVTPGIEFSNKSNPHSLINNNFILFLWLSNPSYCIRKLPCQLDI